MAEFDSVTFPQCSIRPACKGDRWTLQQFVLGLVWTEALGFDFRLIAYRLTQAVLLAIVAALGIWCLSYTPSILLRSVLMAVVIYAGFWVTLSLGIIALYVALIPTEPLFNWSLYRIVECDKSPVGCVALASYGDFAVLYHVYIAKNYRRQSLAFRLVQHLQQEATEPIYLVCKPKLVPFYTRLGFVSVPWDRLSKALRSHFKDFERDRQFSRTRWEIMCSSQL